MKYTRFKIKDNNKIQHGIFEDDKIRVISDFPWFAYQQLEQISLSDEIIFLAPVEPSKIICIGHNYHAHVEASYTAKEAPEQPLVFLKPPSSIVGQNENIVLPSVSERVDYEAELALVIGKQGKDIDESDADEYIFGLTCSNDVTARDLQKSDGQWSRAKGFDTFCPTGPFVTTGIDYSDLSVEAILNGEVMQSGRTSQMIFKIPFLISYLSKIMTLNRGDLILTGTPAGISPMKSGDKIDVCIESVGRLSNKVK